MSDSMSDHLIPVFVYGTLKRGYPNYDESLLGAYFREIASSREAFPLVVANRFYSPVLIDEPGAGFPVSGELYCVTETVLARLDEMESVGKPGGYHRELIDIELQDGRLMPAHAYLKHRSDLEVIHSDPMREYPLDDRYVPAAMR